MVPFISNCDNFFLIEIAVDRNESLDFSVY